MNENKKIEKLGDNDYYKPNFKENDANEVCSENAKENDATAGSNENENKSYGRNEELYTDQLLKKQLRQHFITIPQSKQDLNEIHENLISVSKNVKYILTAQEQHEDGGKHYHIIITGTKQLYVSSIHKKIMEAKGDIKGSINYQKIKSLKASITYCKKDGQYLEYGTPSKQSNSEHQNKIDQVIAEAIENENTKEENIEFIRKSLPSYWIQYKEQIINELQAKEIKHRKSWKPKVWNPKNTTLRPYQQRVWDLIQNEPLNRRIIWVSGRANSGKSFMFNYINQNYEYGIYNAGSTASLDNAIYGYDGEGAIAWDIPMSYDFETYGDALAATIEKFSDYGQHMTSRKYKGKRIQVVGHVIVFSNHPPIKQLSHRDVIHIKTNQGESIEKRLSEVGVKTRIQKNGKRVWELQITENGIPGTIYKHSMADLPKHIREIYNE